MNATPQPSAPREPTRISGPVAAGGLVLFILALTALAWTIHKWNLWARASARDAAQAAEAEETGTAEADTEVPESEVTRTEAMAEEADNPAHSE